MHTLRTLVVIFKWVVLVNSFNIRWEANEKLRITSAGKIGIGAASPVTDVDISQKTGAVALPQGTTAQETNWFGTIHKEEHHQ